MIDVIKGIAAPMYGIPLIGNWNFTDDGGAQGAFTVFTVTGDVMVAIFGICKTGLTSGGAATIEFGVSGNTAVFIGQATATDLIANEIWRNATPTTTIEQFGMNGRNTIISNSQNMILTIATADLTAGDIDFYCFWTPLSSNGNIVVA